MYLQELRELGSANCLKRMALWADAPSAEDVIDELDATLNSWECAHHAFESAQGAEPEVTYEAFRQFRPMVFSVIRERLMNTIASYPVEVLTYALLERWIEAAKQERSISENAN